MSSIRQAGLRQRTRLAVRREITKAAEALFVERGFEATTIEDIADAIGVSQRSVHRYFASKEEIVLGKFDFVAEDMLATLRSCPADEPVWAALHRTFGAMLALAETPQHAELVEPIHRVIFDTPALLAGYLQKLQQMQEAVVDELLTRAAAAGTPYEDDDPTPRAVTAAAFGCLVAAQRAWLTSPSKSSLTSALDRAMATVRPRSE